MDAFDQLTKSLARLPGLGRRSAERMATRLVLEREGLLADLIAALTAARDAVCCCSLCGSVTAVDRDPCRLCTGAGRDNILCVVEMPNDIAAIERSNGFHGRYHALMGRLSPMRGEGIEHLRTEALVERVKREGFDEVLLALSTDVEGDATANYVAERLAGGGARVSRIAFGLPSGSGVTYSDPVTLSRAIQGRTAVP